MKNKIFFRIITLALVLVLCLGAAACAKGNTDAETSETTAEETTAETTTADSGSGSGQSNVSSEETLFAELIAAYRASAAYNGSLSFSLNQTSSSNMDDYSYSVVSDAWVSIDVVNNIYYSKSEAIVDGTSYTDTEKVFAVDGEFYYYDCYSFVDAEDEDNCYEEESYAKGNGGLDSGEQMSYLSELIDGFVGGVAKAESFAALKTAFTKTYNEIKARERAELIEDGELAQDASFDLVPEASIKRVSGEVVLTIVTRMTASSLYDAGDAVNNFSAVYTRTIAAKNGKISGLDMSLVAGGDMATDSGDDQVPPTVEPAELSEATGKMESSISMQYNIEYGFNQAVYDAIQVSLPENPDEIEDGSEYETAYVSVKFGDIEAINADFGENTEEFMLNVEDEAEWAFGYDSIYDDVNGWTDIPNVTIHGFYKDAALTQPITATTTREEILALDCVYADYSVREGYAIVMENYDSVREFSLDYQIILADPYGYSMGDVGSKSGRAISASELFFFDVSEDAEYRITVNGAAVTAESMPLEAGKIYDVKYVRVDTDKDFDLTMLFMDML